MCHGSLQVRWPIDRREADDPHAKAGLLLQAHLGRTPLPVSDYFTDTRTVLDNSLRILQVPTLQHSAPTQSARCCLLPIVSSCKRLHMRMHRRPAGCAKCLPLNWASLQSLDANHVEIILSMSQAMVDICAEAGWLDTALNVMHIVQALMQVSACPARLCKPSRNPCISSCGHAPLLCMLRRQFCCWHAHSQARWPDDSAFTMLPGVDGAAAVQLAAAAAGGNGSLPTLLKGLRERPADAQKVLRKVLGNEVRRLPN